MAQQTTLTRPRPAGPSAAANSSPAPVPQAAKAVSRNVADFGHDFVSLLELQVKLFWTDVQELKRGAIGWGLAAAAALVLLLACLPVGMLALGWLLVEQAGWSRAAAFGVAGVAGLVIGAVTLWLCGRRFAGSFSALRRSKDELVQNMEWIKTVLKEGGGVRRW
jgi:hypothetical protein